MNLKLGTKYKVLKPAALRILSIWDDDDYCVYLDVGDTIEIVKLYPNREVIEILHHITKELGIEDTVYVEDLKMAKSFKSIKKIPKKGIKKWIIKNLLV